MRGESIQVPKPLAKNQPITESIIVDSSEQFGDHEVLFGILGEHSNVGKQLKKIKGSDFTNAFSYSKSSKNIVSAGQFAKTEAERIASNFAGQRLLCHCKKQRGTAFD